MNWWLFLYGLSVGFMGTAFVLIELEKKQDGDSMDFFDIIGCAVLTILAPISLLFVVGAIVKDEWVRR